jgi:peptidase M48-like protein
MKKNLFILTLILSLGFSSNSYPMAGIASYFTKECLKKAVEKVTTGLHWTIAAGPIWRDIADRLIDYEKIKKQQEWIRQELKSLGHSNWETVNLVPCSEFAASGDFRTQTLYYCYSRITEAYNEQHPFYKQLPLLNWICKPFETKEKYNEVRATLSHEISHLKSNDAEKRMAIGFMTPFITHLVSKKIANLASIPITNFALRNGFKILSGFGKSVINMLPAWAYLNFAEKNADENIVNDIEVLEGAARLFRSYAEYESHPDFTAIQNAIIRKRLIKLPDPHEDSLKRAQRFEERIAELKKSIVSK